PADLLEGHERRPGVDLRGHVVAPLLEREAVELLALRAGRHDDAVGGLIGLALLAVAAYRLGRDLDRHLVGHALPGGGPEELGVTAGGGQRGLGLLVAVAGADAHDPAHAAPVLE